jgi:hypothetical protein
MKGKKSHVFDGNDMMMMATHIGDIQTFSDDIKKTYDTNDKFHHLL